MSRTGLGVMVLAVMLALPLSSLAMTPEEAQVVAHAAQRGHVGAQVLLAGLYLRGDGGLAKDERLAAYWFEQAAEQGYQDAVELVHLMESVGWSLEEMAHQGPVDPRDLARDGDPDAAYRLAMRHESGAYGVPRDEAQALYWFKRAAEGGSVPGMRALEDVYRRGLLGQKADPAQAEAWRARIPAAIGR